MTNAVRTLTERQYGVVAKRQLRADGLSEAAIRKLLDRGWLIRLYPTVYAMGNRVLPPRGRLMGAVLACGPSALLSHRSAGSLWDLLSSGQANVDVTIPGTSRDQCPGIRRHRTRRLHAQDIAAVGGIPVTSLARTILDLAGVLRVEQTLGVIEQADRIGILNFNALRRAIERRPNVKGVADLNHIIAGYIEPPETRSELERRFLATIRQAGLPEPLLNANIDGLIVDVYWPRWRLVVELDSRAYHRSPRQFENDRIRDARLQRLGIRVLRVTHQRFETARAEILADIRALAALA